MSKPIEDNDNAKEFWENLSDASALDLFTKNAIASLLGLNSQTITVRNTTGSLIPAFTFVAITGDIGTSPLISIADKDTTVTVAGITTESIADNATGLIELTGTIGGINTNALTPGADIFLGDDGAFTTTPPTPGNIIWLGKVGVAHPSAGTLLLNLPARALSAEQVASAISAATSKSTPVAADEFGYRDSVSGNFVKIAWSALVTMIETVINAMATITGNKTASGSWAFSSTTRPTSSGTGTPASNSLITTSDGDARFMRQAVNTEPTPSTTSGSTNKSWMLEYWRFAAMGTGDYKAFYGRVYFSHDDLTESLVVIPSVDISGAAQGVYSGKIIGESQISGRFSTSQNGNIYINDRQSDRLALGDSGVATMGYRYMFSTNFSANVGDTIVMSPSGHTFIVDKTITDATVFTDFQTGGVFVRKISTSPAPTTSDTSLTVNGGSAITTTYVKDSGSNSGSVPIALLFWSSLGFQVWTSNFGGATGFLEISGRDIA